MPQLIHSPVMRFMLAAWLCVAFVSTLRSQIVTLNFDDFADYQNNFVSLGPDPQFLSSGGMSGGGSLGFSHLNSGISTYHVLQSQPIPLRASYEMVLRFQYHAGFGSTLNFGIFSDDETFGGYQPTGIDPSMYTTLGSSNSVSLFTSYTFLSSGSFFPIHEDGDWLQLVLRTEYLGTALGVIDHYDITGTLYSGSDLLRQNPIGEAYYSLNTVQFQNKTTGYVFFGSGSTSDMLYQIDQFTLNAIPEPDTWVLLVVAGIVGFLWKKRKMTEV